MDCKICLREYKDRPNDLCDYYLHWQSYVYKLEAKGLIEKREPPKFAIGDRVKIAVGKAGTIEDIYPRSRRASQHYNVRIDDREFTIRVAECDLSRVE